MKNVQIPLMIFILSLLLLSRSQSILQTVSPTNYSPHFTHIYDHVQSHINIAKYVQSSSHSAPLGRSSTEAQRPTPILGWRQAMWCSTALSYQSCIGCYNFKLCQYNLILGC